MRVDGARWDEEADVVVVGYGGAGAVAAVTAHDAGARVLVLERQPPERRHPSTFMAAGSILCPSDVEAALRYMTRLYAAAPGLSETDPSVLRAWAEYSSQNLSWIEQRGGKVKLFRKVGEHQTVADHHAVQQFRFDMIDHPTPWGVRGYGYGLFTWLSGLVAQRTVEVMYGVRARRLLTNGHDDIVGVRADRGGREISIRADRAVVLTTGGFEFNEWLKLQYLRVYPTYFYSNPDNTGDGISMAQDVGAALWHMNACSAKAIAWFPDAPTGFSVNFWGYGGGMTREDTYRVAAGEGDGTGIRAACGVMQVDRYGKRFTNEVWKQHTHYYELTLFDSHKRIYPRVPCYWIFDDARMSAGQLVGRESGAAGPLQMYSWSHDNQRELERGWIVKGDTIEELARMLEMDAATLKETLREYNEACATGRDPLGRPARTLVPLDAPFYAMRLWPGGPNTQGGPQRNARAQVLNVDGEPIPRLYAAGELGSIYGMLYPLGGGNLGECIAFGRIAGENAAQERPLRSD